MIRVSIIVPIFLGEKYIQPLIDEIEVLRIAWDRETVPMVLHQLIFVDDDARDNSASLLELVSRDRPWIKVLTLSRNYGQHAATMAGIVESSGDWVVTLDEDLQHPPARISDLLRKAAESSSDLVYAVPVSAIHAAAIRDMSSRLYKMLMHWMTGDANIKKLNSFRLIRGSIARDAAALGGHDTYYDIALSWYTTRISHVSMQLQDNRYIETGKSGYNIKSLVSHARRMLVSSQLKFLRFGIFTGATVLAMSLAAIVAIVLLRLVLPEFIDAQGWTSLFVAVIFFGGINLMMLGIIHLQVLPKWGGFRELLWLEG